MFGLGLPEIAIILVVALLVLGPSKLPELARGLGKGLREFRKATEDFKSTMDDELHRPEPPRPRASDRDEPAQLAAPVHPAVSAAEPAPSSAAEAARPEPARSDER